MAYVQLMISGNTSFGGYLSVDGQKKATPIGHDVTYELSAGKHTLTIYSTSDFERGSKAVYNWGSTGGSKLANAVFDPVMKGAEGDSWQFSVNLEEKDCAVVTVTTKGEKFVEEPRIEVGRLTDEEYQMYVQRFEEMRNTPRRNKKQMGWGIGIAAACAFGLFNFLGSGAMTTDGPATLFVLLGGIALGAVLFALGVQKKVRR